MLGFSGLVNIKWVILDLLWATDGPFICMAGPQWAIFGYDSALGVIRNGLYRALICIMSGP